MDAGVVIDIFTDVKNKKERLIYREKLDKLDKLHNVKFLFQISNSSHLLLTVVTMVGNRVVAAKIIVALVADGRESFTGATMVNF